jgi:hypothetical protein
MKKNLSVFAAAVLLFVAVACDKPGGGDSGGGATYCYTCISTATYTGTGTTQTPTEVTQEVCGLTEEGARNMEKSGTTTATSGNITYNSVMKCTRK